METLSIKMLVEKFSMQEYRTWTATERRLASRAWHLTRACAVMATCNNGRMSDNWRFLIVLLSWDEPIRGAAFSRAPAPWQPLTMVHQFAVTKSHVLLQLLRYLCLSRDTILIFTQILTSNMRKKCRTYWKAHMSKIHQQAAKEVCIEDFHVKFRNVMVWGWHLNTSRIKCYNQLKSAHEGRMFDTKITVLVATCM